jgi:hypothetical protein
MINMANRSTFFNTPWDQRGPVERVLIISSVLGATIGGIVLTKRTIEAIKARRAQKALQSDVEGFQQQGQKLSYPLGQYVILADTLYTAMNSSAFDWGTDETQVAGVMYKMKNDLDVNQLIKAFDRRDGYTLPEWIAGDFSQEDKEFYINNILRKKGIKYRF